MRFVARLAQLVADVLQLQILVVAFDRKDLAQHALDALVFALIAGYVVLQEILVAARLNLCEIGDGKQFTAAAEAANFLRGDATLGRSCHENVAPQNESKTWLQPRGRRQNGFNDRPQARTGTP